ncbi:hypothetical protein DV515_00005376 [Chloebia gouldiae]|uniref:Uncharacterized protein n=1 Tax=Chloebia gouldiae TaxID=44316 RepID=A0A3L8SND1_CHLGU|nr:hypothetical protein DV515_00005376 [Chloebia gouldiae]
MPCFRPTFWHTEEYQSDSLDHRQTSLLSPLEQVRHAGRKSFLKIRAGSYTVRAFSGSKHEALLTAFPSPSTTLVSSALYFQGVFSTLTFRLSRG